MSQSYIVEGMTCSGCAKAVTNALKELNASILVDVDLDKKQVTVDGFNNEEKIIEAIEDAGFDFIGKA